MKINRIVFYNIGPYIDRNVFEITKDKNRNIVLIGGRNGAGKTTFFRSIKTCLYGCKVWGYDAPGREYLKIIDSLINMRMQYDSSVKAYVEIELSFDDGKQNTTYLLHREWSKERSSIKEHFHIEKDKIKLDEEEQLDFVNYLLSIIPPDMFNFYFFDGESIADYFLGNDGGKNFKNAFLKLYGLDTLSLMIENFNRYSKKRMGKNSEYELYCSAKKQLEDIIEQGRVLEQEIRDTEQKIDECDVQLQYLQYSYVQAGGVSAEEWKKLNIQVAKEELRREEINRWLKEIANHYIPFLLIKRELQELSAALENEQTINMQIAIRETFQEKEFSDKVHAYLKENQVFASQATDLIQFICNEIVSSENYNSIFDLSKSELSKITSQIYEKLSFDEESIQKAIKELESSLRKNKQLKNKMAKSNFEGYDEFSKEKNLIENQITILKNELSFLISDIERTKECEKEQKQNFDKAKLMYEKSLKDKSINDMSARAVAAYTLLEDKLIKRQGKILQEEFIKCFSSIINKENFVDGIIVDSNINVIPYKFIDVTFLQIDNYIQADKQNQFLNLFDKKYISEINDLRLGRIKSIKLPTPITSPFSQGERQVYIMSLYLALLKTSRKDIPFFIDTPFARIDSTHRDKIVKEFFKGITNQMFILSTDEEIVGEYKNLIKEEISNEFLLQINDYGRTSIIPNIYFERK